MTTVKAVPFALPDFTVWTNTETTYKSDST